MMATDANKRIVIGRIGTTYGVRGWLKLRSYTQPKENILDYLPWQLKQNDSWTTIDDIESKCQGKDIVIHFANCETPEQAKKYTGIEIAVNRAQLPEINGYYWADLEGLSVTNTAGIALGKVTELIATGSNDVLIVKGEKEHLIPFLLDDFVLKIDLANKTMLVDWDAEF